MLYLFMSFFWDNTDGQVSTLSPPVVEVMDVDFKYSTGPTILKNVNFGLDQASRVCIVGPNGAGKEGSWGQGTRTGLKIKSRWGVQKSRTPLCRVE